MITSIKGIELQAGEEIVDYLVSSQLDAEMLTPADTDSQISSSHVNRSEMMSPRAHFKIQNGYNSRAEQRKIGNHEEPMRTLKANASKPRG